MDPRRLAVRHAFLRCLIGQRRHPAGGASRPGFSLCTALFAALLATSLLGGCSLFSGTSKKDALSAIDWSYASNGVVLEVNARPELNEYDGESHTVLLGVVQTSDAQAFRQVINDPAALAQLMQSGKGGTGFLQFSRYVVAPGQHSVVILDRAQNARYVGLSVGYYTMSAETSARLIEVPVAVTSSGWVSKSYQAAPAPLVMRLTLGARAILDAERVTDGSVPTQLQQAVPVDGGGKSIKLTPDCNCAGFQDNTLRKLAN